MITLRPIPEEFLVAFSFAGEQRKFVRQIAEAVEQRLGRGMVFYDAWFPHYLPGAAADIKLQSLYSQQTKLVIACLSAEYGTKEWTMTEWDAIRSRRMKLRTASEPCAADRVQLLRVADGDVPGLLDNDIWEDARRRSPQDIAETIVARLRRFEPDAGKPRVFLAECTPDMEDDKKLINRQNLRRFLETTDWCVLPDCVMTDSSKALVDLPNYNDRLREQLLTCQAFVQLLGERRWKGGRFDRIQYEVAVELDLPRFSFRGDVDLDAVKAADPSHYELIKDAVKGGFQDFKDDLGQQLQTLAQQRVASIRQAQQEESRAAAPPADDPPLVRVAVRAREGDRLREMVFTQLIEKRKILSDELAANESFRDKHQGEPCHGFLILCDEAALSDEQFSPRKDLEHCRLIQWSGQAKENPNLRPPVGLIFWPPPEKPAWFKLLKSTPDPNRLHKVVGDSLGDLTEFLDQVCQVRQLGRAES